MTYPEHHPKANADISEHISGDIIELCPSLFRIDVLPEEEREPVQLNQLLRTEKRQG